MVESSILPSCARRIVATSPFSGLRSVTHPAELRWLLLLPALPGKRGCGRGTARANGGSAVCGVLTAREALLLHRRSLSGNPEFPAVKVAGEMA